MPCHGDCFDPTCPACRPFSASPEPRGEPGIAAGPEAVVPSPESEARAMGRDAGFRSDPSNYAFACGVLAERARVAAREQELAAEVERLRAIVATPNVSAIRERIRCRAIVLAKMRNACTRDLSESH